MLNPWWHYEGGHIVLQTSQCSQVIRLYLSACSHYEVHLMSQSLIFPWSGCPDPGVSWIWSSGFQLQPFVHLWLPRNHSWPPAGELEPLHWAGQTQQHWGAQSYFQIWCCYWTDILTWHIDMETPLDCPEPSLMRHRSVSINHIWVWLCFSGSPAVELYGSSLQPVRGGQHGWPAALPPEDRPLLLLSLWWTLAVQHQRGFQVQCRP